MSITSVSSTTASTWAAKPKSSDASAAFEQVVASITARPTIPAVQDSSWMAKNLSAQDRATITTTAGIRFGATGAILVPMSASPNDSYALQKTVHQLNSQRGGFPKDLTPEEILRLVQQNPPGANPEPLQHFFKRTYNDGKVFG